MLKKCVRLVLCLTLCSILQIGFAKEYLPEVFEYVQNDGTIILYAGRVSEDPAVEFNRIFKADGEQYSALRIATSRANSENMNVDLILDGISYPLSIMEDARKDPLPPKLQQKWYKVSNELEEQLQKVQTISVRLHLSNGKSDNKDIKRTALQSLKFIASVHTIDDAKAYVKSIDKVTEFRIFIPNKKPADIAPALIYQANYYPLGKFNNSDYYQAKFSNDWTTGSFEDTDYIYEKYMFPYIWSELKEEKDGTRVSLNLFKKIYHYSTVTDKFTGVSFTRLSSINYESMKPSDKLHSQGQYELNMWAYYLRNIYTDLYGTYSYGLKWDMIAKKNSTEQERRDNWSTAPYFITSVDGDNFKELRDISAGDQLVAINGKATDAMYFYQTLMETEYAGNPAVFTLRNKDGIEKEVTVTPTFTPTTKQINYLEILNKDKRQLKHVDLYEGYPYDDFRTYDPLGQGDV
ncbi:hypothetical protein [Pelosinus fermentans]|uniref:hypothetical protein n=1 Tax=Pelosinus fermentans TaxID=365349 RepID=UPI0002684A99|nr:hypothetical protein [Pelosinus fermentans]EIW21674.1 hypothetical protein FA11_0481 [Pelosinus fermentans A11]